MSIKMNKSWNNNPQMKLNLKICLNFAPVQQLDRKMSSTSRFSRSA